MLKIPKARLSYPALFKPSVFQGVEGKYEATLIIPKKDPVAKKLQREATRVAKEGGAKYATLSGSRSCIRDGDGTERPELAGCITLKARNTTRPTVINRDRSPLTPDDGKPYAGCYVAALVSFWLQDNSFGRRINANLHGVQFVADGEPFGAAGSVASADQFDDLEAGDDDANDNDNDNDNDDWGSDND